MIQKNVFCWKYIPRFRVFIPPSSWFLPRSLKQHGWNGWKPIRRQTFEGRATKITKKLQICPERPVVIFRPILSTFAFDVHRVSIPSKTLPLWPAWPLAMSSFSLCYRSITSENWRASPSTRAFCRVNCHHGRGKKGRNITNERFAVSFKAVQTDDCYDSTRNFRFEN